MRVVSVEEHTDFDANLPHSFPNLPPAVNNKVLKMMATMLYAANTDPAFTLPGRSPSNLQPVKSDFSLLSSVDVEELKRLIRASHPSKCFKFSLLHMRNVAEPPVQIPAMYRCRKATTMLVSGRPVPFTREMWMRQARAQHSRLDTIIEDPFHQAAAYGYK